MTHMMVVHNTFWFQHGFAFCKRHLSGQAPHDYRQSCLFCHQILDMSYCLQSNPPHVSPNHPSTHWHSKPSSRSVQRPLSAQGLLTHPSRFVLQSGSVHPGSHKHSYPSPYRSWHFPLPLQLLSVHSVIAIKR